MKKSLLLTFAALFAVVFGATAEVKTYADQLVVAVNGETGEAQQAAILLEEAEDGTCNLSLNNFCLISGADVVPVGNIQLKGVVVAEENGVKNISTEQTIQITAGDLEGIPMWMGPMIGDVPVALNGEYTADKLYCIIDIDLSKMGQIVKVTFGTEISGGTSELINKAYIDQLVVSVNGETGEPQQAAIYLEELEDGTCNLSLDNFCLISGADVVPVGNIQLKDVAVAEENGVKKISTEQTIQITAGDLEGVPMWMGPMIGDAPVALNGEYTADKLYCIIDIDLSKMGQLVKVTFGEGTEGVKDVEVSNGLVDVYSLTGVCLRKGVDAKSAFEGLPKGYYAVKGKVVYVK